MNSQDFSAVDDLREAVGVLQISLVFIAGSRQLIRQLSVRAGATVEEVVIQSGVLQELPSLMAGSPGFASHGKRLAPKSPVRQGQRIEILLPLRMSPAEARRLLAGKKQGLLKRRADGSTS